MTKERSSKPKEFRRKNRKEPKALIPKEQQYTPGDILQFLTPALLFNSDSSNNLTQSHTKPILELMTEELVFGHSSSVPIRNELADQTIKDSFEIPKLNSKEMKLKLSKGSAQKEQSRFDRALFSAYRLCTLNLKERKNLDEEKEKDVIEMLGFASTNQGISPEESLMNTWRDKQLITTLKKVRKENPTIFSDRKTLVDTILMLRFVHPDPQLQIELEDIIRESDMNAVRYARTLIYNPDTKRYSLLGKNKSEVISLSYIQALNIIANAMYIEAANIPRTSNDNSIMQLAGKLIKHGITLSNRRNEDAVNKQNELQLNIRKIGLQGQDTSTYNNKEMEQSAIEVNDISEAISLLESQQHGKRHGIVISYIHTDLLTGTKERVVQQMDCAPCEQEADESMRENSIGFMEMAKEMNKNSFNTNSPRHLHVPLNRVATSSETTTINTTPKVTQKETVKPYSPSLVFSRKVTRNNRRISLYTQNNSYLNIVGIRRRQKQNFNTEATSQRTAISGKKEIRRTINLKNISTRDVKVRRGSIKTESPHYPHSKKNPSIIFYSPIDAHIYIPKKSGSPQTNTVKIRSLPPQESIFYSPKFGTKIIARTSSSRIKQEVVPTSPRPQEPGVPKTFSSGSFSSSTNIHTTQVRELQMKTDITIGSLLQQAIQRAPKQVQSLTSTSEEIMTTSRAASNKVTSTLEQLDETQSSIRAKTTQRTSQQKVVHSDSKSRTVQENKEERRNNLKTSTTLSSIQSPGTHERLQKSKQSTHQNLRGTKTTTQQENKIQGDNTTNRPPMMKYLQGPLSLSIEAGVIDTANRSVVVRELQKMLLSKSHVSVRPWVPQKIPYAVTQDMIRISLSSISHTFQESIYVGWVKTHQSTGRKKKLVYRVATGKTRKEAKRHFKQNSEGYSWIISS